MTISASDKLMYLAAGFGIGAVAGILFAPRAGSEIRNTLANRVTGISEGANHTFRNVVEGGRNIASIARERINESIEAGKRKFNESIEGEESASR
jgi:gas vesicle protein